MFSLLLLSPSGSSKDGGILPRSLAVIFNSVGERLYQAMDLKPSLSSEVTWLDSKQVHQEEIKKLALLCRGLREVSAPSGSVKAGRRAHWWGQTHAVPMVSRRKC